MRLEANVADEGHQSGFPDLDRALVVQAAEEMSFDWPEYLPGEWITQGIVRLALGSLLFAGIVALGGSLFARLHNEITTSRISFCTMKSPA
jgi:hypothetical protein